MDWLSGCSWQIARKMSKVGKRVGGGGSGKDNATRKPSVNKIRIRKCFKSWLKWWAENLMSDIMDSVIDTGSCRKQYFEGRRWREYMQRASWRSFLLGRHLQGGLQFKTSHDNGPKSVLYLRWKKPTTQVSECLLRELAVSTRSVTLSVTWHDAGAVLSLSRLTHQNCIRISCFPRMSYSYIPA